MSRNAVQKAREAAARRQWRDAAAHWLEASASNPVAAWTVGKALHASQPAAALRFIRAAAYGGHPHAIDFMARRTDESQAAQRRYWARLLPHVTLNGQLPPEEPEAFRQALRSRAPNALYLEAWGLQNGLLAQTTDPNLCSAHEVYRAAASEGHPLGAIGYLRTWDAYQAQEPLDAAITLVASASADCAPALYVYAEQMLLGRRGNEAEAVKKLKEAAEAGERSAQERLGELEPRAANAAYLQAAAENGSARAMRAAAKLAEPPRAVDLLIGALSEEVPGTLLSRALARLLARLRAEQNLTAALSVVSEGEAAAAKLPHWAACQEEARRELAQLTDAVAKGLESPAAPATAPVTAPLPSSSSAPLPATSASPPAPSSAAPSLARSQRVRVAPPSAPNSPGSPTYDSANGSGSGSGSGRSQAASAQFSVPEFLRQADISGPDAEAFSANAIKEKCDTEDVLLSLTDEHLKELGLCTIGDRRRFQAAAKAWQERRTKRDADVSLQQKIIPSSSLSIEGEPLGKGNFGAVYRGYYNGATAAVKILHDSSDLMNQAEFRKEAKTLAELPDHPNVIRFFGICKLSLPNMGINGWCIVTEFMANGDLKSFLEKRGRELEPRQLLSFCISCAAGMLHLSTQEPPILHRDLAARNLLVGDPYSADGLRVADFGLARAQSEYGMSSGGAVPIRWTAPEVLNGRPYSVYSDVWSFGITMWEIFTLGQRPYNTWGDDAQSVVKRVQNGERLPQVSNGVEVPQEVYVIMLECWHAEPTRRTPFRELHAQLRALEGQFSVRRKQSLTNSNSRSSSQLQSSHSPPEQQSPIARVSSGSTTPTGVLSRSSTSLFPPASPTPAPSAPLSPKRQNSVGSSGGGA